MTPPLPLAPRFVNTVELTLAVLQRPVAQSRWSQLFDSLDTLLDATRAALPEQSYRMQQHIEYWRARLHPWFLQAPLIARAFHKPRGHPNDFELLNMLYRDAPQGETQLGRMLHQYMSSWRMAAAVRSRRQWIVRQIVAWARHSCRPLRVLSLGAGPAAELQDLVREESIGNRLELTCIDHDSDALVCAAQGLAAAYAITNRHASARLVQSCAKRLMMFGVESLGIPQQDFIFCLDVYDGLSDRAARLLTVALYDALAPGGRLAIGNVAPNSDCFRMNLICGASPIYRDDDEVRSFAADLPPDALVGLARESLGIETFAIVDKPPAPHCGVVVP